MLRHFVLMSLVVVTLALAAQSCNTMRGVGKDVEAGGKAIQRGASK